MKALPPCPSRAFTLVEMLVAMALVCIIAVLLVSTTNSAGSLWRYTTNRIEEFRGARTAFEEITRNLSQATLNTYWDYDNPQTPKKYQRQSDLRFISGPSETMLFATGKGAAAPTARRPTHGVFFQSPLGLVDDATHFSGLANLLNTWGYYVEFNQDTQPVLISKGIKNPPPLKYRYRLMELMEPSNALTLYSYTSGKPTYNLHDWFTVPLNGYPSATGSTTLVYPTHVLAENVIALILLPKLSPADEKVIGKPLSPNYQYDSTVNGTTPELNNFNQLPPVMQVTLVAIDEVSAARMATRPPSLTPPAYDSLLGNNTFILSANYNTDLAALQSGLTARHLGFRVFTSDVSIRGARWSRK